MPRLRPQLRRVSRLGDPRVLLQKIDLGQPWQLPTNDAEIDLRLLHLLDGHDHFGDIYRDPSEAKLLWEGVRSRFLEEHIRRVPGTRPWAWWEWDSPEPRRILQGNADSVLSEAGSWMGAPATGNLVVESQAAYLRRHRLLAPSERKGTRRFPAVRAEDPATAYATAVVDGSIVAGQLARFACERHLQDLETGHLRGWFYDRRRAHRFLSFTRFVHHYKGRFAGKRLELLAWQKFVASSIFGWIGERQFRRYRVAWLEVAKKNGKTFLLATVGLYFLMADGEGGPELYCAASQLSQAKLAHRDMRMVGKSGAQLGKRLRILSTRIDTLHIVGGTAVALARAKEDTADRHDGINPHLGLFDEIHAHNDRAIWDLVQASMVARTQPLLFAITTAGFRREWFGGQQSLHFESVVDPRQPIVDDQALVYIARMDSREEVEDPNNWIKANPSLGVSVATESLQAAIDSARGKPSEWGNVLTKHLNWWASGAEECWLTVEDWSSCSTVSDPRAWRIDALERLRGRPCFGGLDLSSISDTSSLALFFPGEDGARHEILSFCFLPADGFRKRISDEKAPYDIWERDGFVELCPGPYIDQAVIQKRCLELFGFFGFAELAVDPFQAASLLVDLDKAGVPVIQVKQGFLQYNEPCQRLEGMVKARELEHGRNPILAFHVSRVMLAKSSEGYSRPDRKRAGTLGYRIDSACAVLMAIGRWIVSSSSSDKSESLREYEERLASGEQSLLW